MRRPGPLARSRVTASSAVAVPVPVPAATSGTVSVAHSKPLSQGAQASAADDGPPVAPGDGEPEAAGLDAAGLDVAGLDVAGGEAEGGAAGSGGAPLGPSAPELQPPASAERARSRAVVPERRTAPSWCTCGRRALPQRPEG